jgi:ATP-binding cassette subfamily F protein uup
MGKAPLLSATELHKTFAVNPLFEGITISVEEGEKVALIGPNGSGKSTLLKIIAGFEDPDGGEIHRRRGLRMSYIAQDDRFDEHLSVTEVLHAALVATGLDEHELEGRIQIALGKSGFKDPAQKVAVLSGGWRKRLAIVRGLITEPDLLLIDEPTNHLDIEGVLWLEKMLLEGSFGLIFVSHDRYLIENLSERVFEINKRYPSGFFSASGGYADFLEAREAWLANMSQYKDSLANKARREVAWLRQGARARTTKSRARIAEAHRLVAEVQSINIDERRATLEFAASQRKTRELIKVEHASKSIEGRTLFDNLSFILSPGTRLGVVGSNGSGKTTFIRMLLGDTPPDRGRVIRANNLRLAFFDQARKQLDKNLRVKTALCPEGDSVVWNGRSMHVTAWAQRFLLTPEQLALPVSSLSGGEQARVLLAQIMVEQADIILFDEPTNDLDINTLEILEESFCEFAGAIVLVTHDRYMLDRTSTIVLGINGRESHLYGEYSQWEQAFQNRPKEAATKPSTPQSSTAKPRTKLGYQEQRELDGIEARIMKAGKRT